MNRKQRAEIVNKIKYELAKGEHTFSMCSNCEKNGARGSKCWECLLEEFL